MKTCFKCQLQKPRGSFYAHPMMSDGLLGKCKECTKADATLRRHQNIEQVREYDRNRPNMAHRLEVGKERSRANRKAFPDRDKARRRVKTAVKNGSLVRWPACAAPDCEVTTVEGHHPDYARPLDVVWLCAVHHRQAHLIKPEL